MSHSDVNRADMNSAEITNTGMRMAARPGLVLSIALVELVAIGLLYKHMIDFRCLDNWPPRLCRGASMSMVSAYTGAGALALLGILLPGPCRRLLAEAGPRRNGLALNIGGVLAMLAPLPFFGPGVGTTYLLPVLSFWALGLGLGGAGMALMLAPMARWRVFLAEHGMAFALCLAAGIAVPVLAQQIYPIWRISVLADATFTSVAWLMSLTGYELITNVTTKSIGTEAFMINVAPVCSGVEGIALVAIFVTIYIALFRRDLRFPAVLLLYPIGMLASWLLNVVRIAVLLAIGLEGNPELAVGGFHSHAGWMMFTLLSVTLLALAQYSHWFTRSAPAGGAAAILPFALFMASALFASTFTSNPGLVYPLRVLGCSTRCLL